MLHLETLNLCACLRVGGMLGLKPRALGVHDKPTAELYLHSGLLKQRLVSNSCAFWLCLPLGLELQASHMLDRHLPLGSIPQS